MFLENVWLQGRKVLYQVVFQLLNVFFNLYSHWLNLCEKTTYFIYVYSKLHKKNQVRSCDVNSKRELWEISTLHTLRLTQTETENVQTGEDK